jgi:hypothetical protein
MNPISLMVSRGLIAFDPNAATPPAPPAAAAPATPAAPAVPAAKPAAAGPTSVADAGKAFLASLTDEQKKAPVAVPDDDDGGIDDPAAPAKVVDPAAPAKPAALAAAKPDDKATAAAAPIGEATEEHVIAREDGAIWNESAKRWQNDAGAFVDGEAPTTDELTALETARAEAKTAADAAAGAAEKKKVKLTGLAEKGEADIELELEDEAAAERIRRLQNDGMRRKAFLEAKTALDEERAEFTAVTQAIDADPVSFILGQMTPERQMDVAKALLAEHFDKLVPSIQAYDDEQQGTKRRADDRLALRDRVDQSRTTMTESQARQKHAVSCMNAAHSLIPENTDPSVARDFMGDVEQDLVAAARAGKPVTPETVPQLIDRRLKLYGFGAGATSVAAPAAPAVPPAAQPTGTARPIGDRATAIAARVVTKEEAKSAQSRIKTVQTTRKTAAAVAPPGAGAAPVQIPVIPADADIRTASKIIRKQGQGGWASA